MACRDARVTGQSPQASVGTLRFVTLAIVARLAPVVAMIADHDTPAPSMRAIPALHATSSDRPL